MHLCQFACMHSLEGMIHRHPISKGSPLVHCSVEVKLFNLQSLHGNSYQNVERLILHVQLLLGFVLIGLFKVDKTRAHSALLTGEVRQIVANFDQLLVQVMEIWFLELHHSRTCGTFEQAK